MAARLNYSSPSTTVALETVHLPITWQESELMVRNNCSRSTILNAMLANNSSTVHPHVLRFLRWLSSCELAQHSVTLTNNFSICALPAASSTRTHPVPARKTVHVPVPNPQMWVPATCVA